MILDSYGAGSIIPGIDRNMVHATVSENQLSTMFDQSKSRKSPITVVHSSLTSDTSRYNLTARKTKNIQIEHQNRTDGRNGT